MSCRTRRHCMHRRDWLRIARSPTRDGERLAHRRHAPPRRCTAPPRHNRHTLPAHKRTAPMPNVLRRFRKRAALLSFGDARSYISLTRCVSRILGTFYDPHSVSFRQALSSASARASFPRYNQRTFGFEGRSPMRLKRLRIPRGLIRYCSIRRLRGVCWRHFRSQTRRAASRRFVSSVT